MALLIEHVQNAIYGLKRTRDYLAILPVSERMKLENVTRYQTDRWLTELNGAIASLERGCWPSTGSRLCNAMAKWHKLCRASPVPPLGKEYSRSTWYMCLDGVEAMLRSADQMPDTEAESDWHIF
jgi:hypothetical protein